MKYSRVYLDSIGYELPPVVVTTSELEDRLAQFIEKGNRFYIVDNRIAVKLEFNDIALQA